MKELRKLVVEERTREATLPSGRIVRIPEWVVAFRAADPPRLVDSDLPRTYLVKPLVLAPDGEPVFGELAILRYLALDGWKGVWVDTFHGGKFWTGMPDKSDPVDLGTVPEAHAMFEKIVSANNGRAGGFYDVFAWRDSAFAFVEHKQLRERPNDNEDKWLEAALSVGVSETNLLRVVSEA